MDYQNAFIKNLKKYRRENNLTQNDLAEMIGYSQKNIAKWEQGHSLPPIDIMVELSKKMKVSLDELLGLNVKSIFSHCYENIVEKHNITPEEIVNDIDGDITYDELIENSIYQIYQYIYKSITNNLPDRSKDIPNTTIEEIEKYGYNKDVLQFLQQNNYLTFGDNHYTAPVLISEVFNYLEDHYRYQVKKAENELKKIEHTPLKNYAHLDISKELDIAGSTAMIELTKEQLDLLLANKKAYYNKEQLWKKLNLMEKHI